MKALLFCAILLLAACTAPAIEQCEQGTIPREFGGCCPDADADGLCDAEGNATPDDTVVNITVPVENRTVMQNTTSTNITDDLPRNGTVIDNRSLSEQWEATYNATVRSMSYYVPSTYGELWVIDEPARTQYITVDRLGLVSAGALQRSQFNYLANDERFIIGIEDRATPVINYWYDDGTVRGCYVQGKSYALGACIKDYPNANPIIQYDFTYERPVAPRDWMRAFHGIAPIALREDRAYRTTGLYAGTIQTDVATFPHENGTAVITVHAKFKAPLQVELYTADGRLRERIVFAEPVFNMLSIDGKPVLPSDRVD